MKISTRGRYAVRLMIDIAENLPNNASVVGNFDLSSKSGTSGNSGFVALKDIAERQDISKKYLEQIIPLLTNAGLLVANRGSQGGYALTRKPEQYTAYEILSTTENMAVVSCLEQTPNMCPRRDVCKTLNLWEGLNNAIKSYLEGITLKDLVKEQAVIDYII